MAVVVLSLTAQQLVSIMPGMTEARAAEQLEQVKATLLECEAVTLARQAAVLGQLGIESDGLRASVEYWGPSAAQLAYEGSKRLGNTEPGDGKRFRGRTWIQLTGRANYAACSRYIGIDLVADPDLAAKPATGARVVGWYWKSKNLNAWADQGTFESFRALTHAINGGENQFSERLVIWAKAKKALGIQDDWAALRLGAAGARVEKLQRALAQAGFAAGPSDGVFGEVTERMVKAFQVSRQLQVDGVAGPMTLAVLPERQR